MTELTVLAALAVEAAALRRAGGGGTVRRMGMGPGAAEQTARTIRAEAGSGPVVVAGTGGGLRDGLAAGDLVVATEVRGPDGDAIGLPGAAPLVAGLRRRGLTVHAGPVVSTRRVATGADRQRLAAGGALVVDTESWWALRRLAGRPLAVVRAVADTSVRGLLHPSIVVEGIAALRTLRGSLPALVEWAAAARPRRILLAGPRSFCAGVDRAIEIVERALDRHGPPVYVRKQIVHNAHVVADLQRRGAIFVDELDEVPDDALTIFSAHGVAPAVRDAAASRDLAVVDATCPLVEKVHAEARRYARDGYDIVLIGHAGHEEVEGTFGEAPTVTHIVDTPQDVDRLEVRDPGRVAVLSQTTLAVDEVRDVIDGLRARFPAIEAPGADDICYATQNRQDAVRAVAADAQLLLVVGSTNSSNSKRLVEVAQREGCSSHLVDAATEVDPRWLDGVDTVGVTAGASAPESLVHGVVEMLAGLGPVEIERRDVTTENVIFQLPKPLR